MRCCWLCSLQGLSDRGDRDVSGRPASGCSWRAGEECRVGEGRLVLAQLSRPSPSAPCVSATTRSHAGHVLPAPRTVRHECLRQPWALRHAVLLSSLWLTHEPVPFVRTGHPAPCQPSHEGSLDKDSGRRQKSSKTRRQLGHGHGCSQPKGTNALSMAIQPLWSVLGLVKM